MKVFKQLLVTRRLWPVWVLAALLMGCRDKATNNLSPADGVTYITNRYKGIGFTQYKTFSLPDSVVIKSNDKYSMGLDAPSSRFINNVATELTKRGFTRVKRGEKADLGVAVMWVNNLYTGVASTGSNYPGSYWGSPYYGYGYGYGYGSSFYYPSYYTYQVSDQYWDIQMVDLKNAPTTPPPSGSTQTPLNVVYEALIYGTDLPDEASADAASTAIFNQSPYLKAN